MADGYTVTPREDGGFDVLRHSDGRTFECPMKVVTIEGVDGPDGTEILRVTDDDGREWVLS